jgi:hypothetical protein
VSRPLVQGSARTLSVSMDAALGMSSGVLSDEDILFNLLSSCLYAFFQATHAAPSRSRTPLPAGASSTGF